MPTPASRAIASTELLDAVPRDDRRRGLEEPAAVALGIGAERALGERHRRAA